MDMVGYQLISSSNRDFSVVKTTVLLKDIGDFATVNEVYGQYFKAPYPARAAYQVSICYQLSVDILFLFFRSLRCQKEVSLRSKPSQSPEKLKKLKIRIICRRSALNPEVVVF